MGINLRMNKSIIAEANGKYYLTTKVNITYLFRLRYRRDTIGIEGFDGEEILCAGIEASQQQLMLAIDQPGVVELIGGYTPTDVVALGIRHLSPREQDFSAIGVELSMEACHCIGSFATTLAKDPDLGDGQILRRHLHIVVTYISSLHGLLQLNIGIGGIEVALTAVFYDLPMIAIQRCLDGEAMT